MNNNKVPWSFIRLLRFRAFGKSIWVYGEPQKGETFFLANQNIMKKVANQSKKANQNFEKGIGYQYFAKAE